MLTVNCQNQSQKDTSPFAQQINNLLIVYLHLIFFFFCFFRLMQQSRGSNSIVPNNSSEVSNNKGQPSSSDPTEVRVALINNADSDDSDSDAAGHTPRDIVTLV